MKNLWGQSFQVLLLVSCADGGWLGLRLKSRQKRAEYSTAFFSSKRILEEAGTFVGKGAISTIAPFQAGQIPDFCLIETPPLVVLTLIGAPPDPKLADNSFLISP